MEKGENEREWGERQRAGEVGRKGERERQGGKKMVGEGGGGNMRRRFGRFNFSLNSSGFPGCPDAAYVVLPGFSHVVFT